MVSSTTALREMTIDVVSSVSHQLSASITRVPIVTFRADQAFAYDIGTTGDLTFTIVRTQRADADDDATDSRLWTNAKFEEMLTNYIDRWQAETDGCTLRFEPLTYGQSIIEENVYLSNLVIKEDKGVAETLYITLNANIGSMTASIKQPTPSSDAQAKGYMDKVFDDSALVTMTSSDSFDHYVLYYGKQTEWNCVSSYSVKCGPEQPFPILILNLSKKNLSAVAPNLVEDIIPGKNRIFINGIGGGEYIVTKTASSGQNYKITAYSIYEQYRASPIGETFAFGQDESTTYKTPFDIITKILTDPNSYGSEETRIYFPVDKIIFCYKTVNNKDNNNIGWYTSSGEFSASTDAWYVLNVCALRLGCKIWFAGGKVYIVDTTAPSSMEGYTSNCAFQDIPTLYVNMDLYEPESPTSDEIAFTQSVCGETELGDEGSDVLKNYTIVQYNSNNGTSTGTVYSDDNPPSTYPHTLIYASRKKFGIRREEYSIPQIKSPTDAQIIADNTNERNCDSEQSIAFRLAETHYSNVEMHEGKYWQPYFSQLTRVGEIYDYSKDLAISNKPNFSNSGTNRLVNKLTLSTVEYFYPQGYAEYWFGIVCPVDLTQNTSVINNIVYNG